MQEALPDSVRATNVRRATVPELTVAFDRCSTPADAFDEDPDVLRALRQSAESLPIVHSEGVRWQNDPSDGPHGMGTGAPGAAASENGAAGAGAGGGIGHDDRCSIEGRPRQHLTNLSSFLEDASEAEEGAARSPHKSDEEVRTTEADVAAAVGAREAAEAELREAQQLGEQVRERIVELEARLKAAESRAAETVKVHRDALKREKEQAEAQRAQAAMNAVRAALAAMNAALMSANGAEEAARNAARAAEGRRRAEARREADFSDSSESDYSDHSESENGLVLLNFSRQRVEKVGEFMERLNGYGVGKRGKVLEVFDNGEVKVDGFKKQSSTHFNSVDR
jgi:hypothetical protein